MSLEISRQADLLGQIPSYGIIDVLIVVTLIVEKVLTTFCEIGLYDPVLNRLHI